MHAYILGRVGTRLFFGCVVIYFSFFPPASSRRLPPAWALSAVRCDRLSSTWTILALCCGSDTYVIVRNHCGAICTRGCENAVSKQTHAYMMCIKCSEYMDDTDSVLRFRRDVVNIRNYCVPFARVCGCENVV